MSHLTVREAHISAVRKKESSRSSSIMVFIIINSLFDVALNRFPSFQALMGKTATSFRILFLLFTGSFSLLTAHCSNAVANYVSPWPNTRSWVKATQKGWIAVTLSLYLCVCNRTEIHTAVSILSVVKKTLQLDHIIFLWNVFSWT